ncbi:MAG: FecR domain-containing protein [Bacteroides sp.]|nr:FecR domain-containing protein [Roseburia sp.]MCM1346562.1 FecR domain-containing protein [Bacteroides sp.]MCM1420560.1 FecR domain-containing protein [Bacteroides sp.]
MINQKELKELLCKKLFGNLTQAENEQLDEWRRLSSGNEELYAKMSNPQFISRAIRERKEKEALASFNKMRPHMKRHNIIPFRHIIYGTVAACAAAIAVFFTVDYYTEDNYVMKAGSRKATLYSPDGKHSDISHEYSYTLRTQPTDTLSSTDSFYTMTVPKGGEYTLTLEDETAIHINSNSSLAIPANFSEENRTVSITGEAYFDVHKDTEHPFIVETGKAQIKVLGTSFNVKNHKDEKYMVVTLEKGSIEISSPIQNETLVPGEQATVFENGDIEKTKLETFTYCAWHKERIIYENKPLYEILNDLGIWYDFETVYEDEELRNLRFSMDIERSADFNDIAELLERLNKIKVKVKKKKCEIMRL